ncbi:MAG: hypothetical protein ACK5TN_15570 [Acidobacteriota bacterium]
MKICTSQGLTGLGEESMTSKQLTAAAIGEHQRYVVGRAGRILESAIRGVEIALWNIPGQGAGEGGMWGVGAKFF